MSKWKNRPDGVTVRRNTLSKYFSSRPVELLQSPALRVLSRSAHLALIRIEIELRRHAGQCNGKLIVTKEQFIEFGIRRAAAVAPALRELEALGLIRIEHGRGGNAEHRQPNRFFLNYLCGATDAHGDITNAWKRFQTLQEAEQIAASARAAKDPVRVARGRRNQGTKRTPRPGYKTYPETAKTPGYKTYPPGQGTKRTPLSILSGGGGAAGGSSPSEPKPKPRPKPKPVAGIGHNLGPPLAAGKIPWSTPHIEEVFGTSQPLAPGGEARTATLMSLVRLASGRR